jgi:uncharacterized protein (TIGR00299 family) protein
VTIAYFDCFSGISGDMTLGALIDAGGDAAVLHRTLQALELADEVTVDVRREQRGHVGGTRVIVHPRERVERSVADLRAVIDNARAPDRVRTSARSALDLLATAEARLHGHDVASAHLHELSGADTLVDLVGAFWLLDELQVERVYSSPLPAPRGMARDMPLPAPASVRVLEGRGAAFVDTDAGRELVTPTGAAFLAVAATFERPAMSLSSIGYGIGSRDVPGNALAVWLGDEVRAASDVTVIETNIDDKAPNLIAALVEDLMDAGALDVTVTPVLMKKGRSGHQLSVMASPDAVARLTDHVLRHSTTLGVRLLPVGRVIAARRIVEVRTELGAARVKVKELGGRPVGVSPEYEDCRRIAREHGLPLAEVMRLVAEAGRREIGLPQ